MKKSKKELEDLIKKIDKPWIGYILWSIFLYIIVSFLRDAIIQVTPNSDDAIILGYLIWIIAFTFPLSIKIDNNWKIKRFQKEIKKIESKNSIYEVGDINEKLTRIDDLLEKRNKLYENMKNKNPRRWSKSVRNWSFNGIVKLNSQKEKDEFNSAA